MIGLLRGTVARFAEDHIILEINGVGYLVHCDLRTLAELGTSGGLIELSIETQVREDSITLYGFLDEECRVWFKRLQGIQGVGARSALSLLSVLTPGQLSMAVMAQDKAPLTKAAGVGPKLASRIVSELKDRLPKLGTTQTGPKTMGSSTPPAASAVDDAISALVQLGYGRSEVYATVNQLAVEGEAKVDDLIRRGLRELST